MNFKDKNSGGDRAQANLDYVIAITIFLMTVAYVFQFMTGLSATIQSHTDELMLASGSANTVLVDRLVAADRPGLVDQEKLDIFINTKLNRSLLTSGKPNYELALDELGLSGGSTIFDVNVSVTYINGTTIYRGGVAVPDETVLGQSRRLVQLVNYSTGYRETVFISMRVW